MKTYFETTVATRAQFEVISLTEFVEQAVQESGVTAGICVVFVPHATAGLAVNEAGAHLEEDLPTLFSQLVAKDGWRHNQLDGNGQAHLLSALFGTSKTFPVEGGRIVRGQWQDVLLLEFDGPRERTVVVKVHAQKIQ